MMGNMWQTRAYLIANAACTDKVRLCNRWVITIFSVTSVCSSDSADCWRGVMSGGVTGRSRRDLCLKGAVDINLEFGHYTECVFFVELILIL